MTTTKTKPRNAAARTAPADVEELPVEAVTDDETTVDETTVDQLESDEQIEEPAASIRVPPADEARQTSTPSAWRRFVRRLMRTLVVVAVIAAGAAAVVVGWPIFNEQVLKPVETNAADTAAMQTQLEQASARIDALEADGAELRTDLGSTVAAQAELTDSLDALTPLIADHTVRLDELDDLNELLTTRMDTTDVAATAQVSMLKSMELLSRSRLFLYQANYGLAEQDVRVARAILDDIVAESPEDAEKIGATIDRLDLVLTALPERPVAASDDLDIAWQILLGDIPAPSIVPAESTVVDGSTGAGASPTTTTP